MSNSVYISLGTNQGDRLKNLTDALSLIEPGISIKICSKIYETPPWGYLNQPVFLNQICSGVTGLEPLELLDHLKKIEKTLGRQETFLYGPRIIDLDILFFNNLVIESIELDIPHPNIQDRAFVLVPLAEIAPDLYHPVLEKRIEDILASLDTTGIELYEASSDK